MEKLPLAFYLRDDVVTIARELIGKVLVTNWKKEFTSGRIVETEAYAGEIDRASHAFRGKTPRTEVMFEQGGTAYVYLCYGIHQMFNIVTNKKLSHSLLCCCSHVSRPICLLIHVTALLDEIQKK